MHWYIESNMLVEFIVIGHISIRTSPIVIDLKKPLFFSPENNPC